MAQGGFKSVVSLIYNPFPAMVQCGAILALSATGGDTDEILLSINAGPLLYLWRSTLPVCIERPKLIYSV